MLSDEERMAIEHLKNYPINWLIENVNESAIKIILNLIEKQSKEIEELKDMNERQKYRIELVSEDKIEERGDSIDESTMLKQIKSKLDEKNIPIETLLAEFERLEDLEDDLTTVYLNGVYDGEKKVEDKIKAKIEEYKKGIKQEEKFTILFNANHIRQAIITELQSLLEKE